MIASLCRRMLGAVAFSLLTTAVAAAATAPPPTSLVVFGDDFSDQGNSLATSGYPLSPPYYHGRFSNGSGYVDDLASTFGLTVTNSRAGGENYAYGAAVSGFGVYPLPPFPVNPPNVQQQAAQYLTRHGGRASSTATFVIFAGGGGDANGFLLNVLTNPFVILLYPSVIDTGTSNVASVVREISRAGARHVVVLNLPNLAQLPVVQHLTGLNGLIGPGLAKAFARSWNDALAKKLSPYGGTTTIEDFYNVANLLLAKAPSLGLTNVKDGCLSGFGFSKTVQNSCAPGAESQHAFYDQIHFTAIGYFGMAQGTACALGQPSIFGARSNCIVTPSNAARSGESTDLRTLRARVRADSRGRLAL